jgi:hypothetical protein
LQFAHKKASQLIESFFKPPWGPGEVKPCCECRRVGEKSFSPPVAIFLPSVAINLNIKRKPFGAMPSESVVSCFSNINGRCSYLEMRLFFFASFITRAPHFILRMKIW